jgi:hypothetical protein
MSTFTAAMQYIGDLDDEFYEDERQRDVWNEASAIGFQLFVWTLLIAGSVLPWVAGVTGSWITLGVLAVFFTVSSMVLMYAKARGLDMYTSQSLARPRIYLCTGVYLIAAFGAMITLASEYLSAGGAAVFVGMAIGACVGVGCGVHGLVRKRRLDREAEAAAEATELQELTKEQI